MTHVQCIHTWTHQDNKLLRCYVLLCTYSFQFTQVAIHIFPYSEWPINEFSWFETIVQCLTTNVKHCYHMLPPQLVKPKQGVQESWWQIVKLSPISPSKCQCHHQQCYILCVASPTNGKPLEEFHRSPMVLTPNVSNQQKLKRIYTWIYQHASYFLFLTIKKTLPVIPMVLSWSGLEMLETFNFTATFILTFRKH